MKNLIIHHKNIFIMIVNSRRQQDKYYADLIYIFLLFHLIKQL